MCKHGTHKEVTVINTNQNRQNVVIDACIAGEIEELNQLGVITLGCCCGHGLAGQIIEWENGFGKWKSHESPPHTLIDEKSVAQAKYLGYSPYPYYYADGENNGVWQMQLKTGCLTLSEVEEWHRNNLLERDEVDGDRYSNNGI